MAEIARFSGVSDAIQLGFVERVHTPAAAMELGIQLHLHGLSLSNTVGVLAECGVDRCRSTVHNWVQKVNLNPCGGREPAKTALDEVIKIDGEQFWFFAAVEPETNEFLHIGLYSSRTTMTTKLFLRELTEKHELEEVEFFVDGGP